MAKRKPASSDSAPSTARSAASRRPRKGPARVVAAAADDVAVHQLTGTVGEGGETHQTATPDTARLTTQQGIPVADDQNTLKAGDRGPSLLEDFHFREKIFHFDHERIPERVVHARGFGAHGFFEPYESLADVTRADLFQRAGEKVPVFVRFSTVAGNKGSFDLARDVRGFAVKFYTQEGNWDLVGNNIPVFFIQDAIKFPDLVHSVKEAPDRGFPQAQSAHDNFWDFISLMPEAIHMVMWTMSDRAIPRSFRFMEGFGVHTFRFVDAAGASTFVKFHWKPKLGLQSVAWNEAVKINGADPDFHRRDLWDAINSGDFPEWELGVQLFDDDFADSFDFDVLDATKFIPEELVPVRLVGRLVLDRTVDNFFAETEQVAFCTQNVVPGIDFTNDPLLQGRNFSYLDTQLKRLGGPNFTHLPVNAPKCPVAHFQQDGHMAMTNPVGRVNYEPNSWSGADAGPREDSTRQTSFAEPVGGVKQRVRSERFGDHFSQARQFYVSQTPIEQAHIVSAFVFELSKCEQPGIRSRLVANLRNVDEDFARQVADGLRLAAFPDATVPARAPITDLPASPALSIVANGPASFAGRKIGVLITDGTDAVVLAGLRKAAAAEGAVVELIAPHIGGASLSDGSLLPVHQTIDGGPSVLYDAVAVLASADGAALLAADAAAKDFVTDAHAHCKFIAHHAGSSALLEAAGVGSNRLNPWTARNQLD
ncbi:MAG: catalase [Ilumatobacteraceae bacterium]